MSKVKKPSYNQIYEGKQKAKGLAKVTLWVPEHATDDLKEMVANIVDFYLEKDEKYHRQLIPAMYRDIKTGRNGNKSLYDIKQLDKPNV